MITKLEIENFRGLDKLVLDGLKRVNVLVGANDVGKTSVLEAIYMLGSAGHRSFLRDMTERRKYAASFDNKDELEMLERIGAPKSIRIAASTTAGDCELREIDDNGQTMLELRQLPAGGPPSPPLQFSPNASHLKGRTPVQPAVTYFDFQATTDEEVARRVGTLNRKKQRGRMVAWLKGVDSRLTDVSQNLIEGARVVETWVDLGLPELLRLTQVGHGLRFAAALYSQLEVMSHAAVLIDEIEVGLHHEALKSVWHAVDQLSRENDLQIFATTHSYECLQAAHVSMAKHEEDLAVFRIERWDDGRLVVFGMGPEDREAVFHYHSEVR